MTAPAAVGPVLEAEAFAARLERITNTVDVDDWLALYAPDAVVEQIVDGVYERHEGLTAVTASVHAMAAVWRAHRLRVAKTVRCADATTVTLSWTGGFRGRDDQFGIEIWTLRDGLVVHQETYGYLRVLPRSAWTAKLRILALSPRIALTAATAGGRVT